MNCKATSYRERHELFLTPGSDATIGDWDRLYPVALTILFTAGGGTFGRKNADSLFSDTPPLLTGDGGRIGATDSL